MIVAPLMRIGICDVLPLALAVMVAVRVAGLLLPDENVTCALPVASLTTVPAERTPVSAANVTLTPATAAFAASTTVAVIVVVLLLSEATLVCEALRVMFAAVGEGVTGVVGVVGVVELPDPPPPHALSNINSTIAIRDESVREVIVFNMGPLPKGGSRLRW